MASSIVDELFDRLIRAFPPDRSYGRGDFSTPPMPAPVAHFLEQLLRRRLRLEMRNIRDASSSWVDYDHPDVQEAERAFQAVIESHLRIPASEWQGMLRRAVQRVTAYSIHPTQTMTNFVFGDREDELSVHVVRDRIQFFSPYPHLREAVAAYIDREETSSISRARFQALITRVDERIVADYDVDDWMHLLDPLFTLMDAADQRGVPVSFLQTFFQSKSASAIVQRLQAESLEQGTTMLDRSDLHRLIAAEVAPSSGDAAPDSHAVPPSPSRVSAPAPASPARHDESAAERSPEPASTESGPAESESVEEAPPREEAASDGPTPLWKRFQHAGPTREESERVTEAVTEDSDDPLWTRFQPKTEPASSPPPSPQGNLDDLERAVLGERGSSYRELFIRDLFGDSREEYHRTLERLQAAPNWTRASQIIAQDVFRTHQVNIYSKPAVAFTNAVEDRFRQRS